MVLPLNGAGKDALVKAKAGTGKTASFLVLSIFLVLL